jgi:hypothetical protein
MVTGYLRDRGAVTEVHLFHGQPAQPSRRPTHDGHRRRGRDDTIHDPNLDSEDAVAGVSGERNFATDPPRGSPDDPPLLRGETGERAPTIGGLPMPTKDPTAEPPNFIDSRSLRIVGRDERGRLFEAAVFGGADPQSQSWARIGDARHGGLTIGHCDDLPKSLAQFQRALNAHYGNTR